MQLTALLKFQSTRNMFFLIKVSSLLLGYWFWLISRNILIIKPSICTNFSNLFLEKTLHVSDSSSVHHQKFFTVHTAMVHVCIVEVCWQLASRIRTRPDPARKLSANEVLKLLASCQRTCVTCSIAACIVKKLLMMDRATLRNLYSFIPKNKFEKLVHLVVYIIRIYHNARSLERQNQEIYKTVFICTPLVVKDKHILIITQWKMGSVTLSNKPYSQIRVQIKLLLAT